MPVGTAATEQAGAGSQARLDSHLHQLALVVLIECRPVLPQPLHNGLRGLNELRKHEQTVKSVGVGAAGTNDVSAPHLWLDELAALHARTRTPHHEHAMRQG